MATYSGRRAPNVSQYIANLNTIQDGTVDDTLQEDLSLFATTDFFDFDMGDMNNLPPQSADFERKSSAWQDSSKGDFINSKSHSSLRRDSFLYILTFRLSILPSQPLRCRLVASKLQAIFSFPSS